MKVVNLGQIGEPKQSPIGGMGNALYKGSVMGRMLSSSRAESEKLKLDKEDTVLKKRAFDLVDKKQTLDRAMQTHELLSQRYATEGKTIMDNFMQGDSGKAILKQLKPNLPEVFDDAGNYAPDPAYKVATSQAEAGLAKAMTALGSGAATEDQLLMLLVSKGDKDLVANTLFEKLQKTHSDLVGNAPESGEKKSSSWYGKIVSESISNIKETGNFMGIELTPDRRIKILMMLQSILGKLGFGSTGNQEPNTTGQVLSTSNNNVTNFKVEE